MVIALTYIWYFAVTTEVCPCKSVAVGCTGDQHPTVGKTFLLCSWRLT